MGGVFWLSWPTRRQWNSSPSPISEELREQDLAQFEESLLWQSEDLRVARGLPEEEEVLDDSDFRYFQQRYRALRRQHERLMTHSDTLSLYEGLHTLSNLGVSLLDIGGQALHQFVAVRPGWYVDRIRELLNIHVPRSYARRFYGMILGHQAILSKQEGREVSLEEAAKDWYTQYHLPTILIAAAASDEGAKSNDCLLRYYASQVEPQ